MATIFWQVKYSLKLGKARLYRYPVGQLFCPNCSILHGFRNTSIFVLCEIFKTAAIFGGKRIFENWITYSAELPCGSKISSFFGEKLKNSKGLPFLVGQKILKIGSPIQKSYPVGQKFCQNHFI